MFAPGSLCSLQNVGSYWSSEHAVGHVASVHGNSPTTRKLWWSMNMIALFKEIWLNCVSAWLISTGTESKSPCHVYIFGLNSAQVSGLFHFSKISYRSPRVKQLLFCESCRHTLVGMQYLKKKKKSTTYFKENISFICRQIYNSNAWVWV